MPDMPPRNKPMGTRDINLDKQTATSINGITLKMAKDESGIYRGVCLNPMEIPPDDLDELILAKMVREAGMFYKMELDRVKG